MSESEISEQAKKWREDELDAEEEGDTPNRKSAIKRPMAYGAIPGMCMYIQTGSQPSNDPRPTVLSQVCVYKQEVIHQRANGAIPGMCVGLPHP